MQLNKYHHKLLSIIILSSLLFPQISVLAYQDVQTPIAQIQIPTISDAPIVVIDQHLHPRTGDMWKVRFQTKGSSDLVIYPQDQATIDDADYYSLTCDDQPLLDVTVLSINNIIYAKNYTCNGISAISHKINKAGKHTLKFQFANQTAYAYNEAGVDWVAFPSTVNHGVKFGLDDVESIAYGGGKFVAVGSGGLCSYSFDGITWTLLMPGDDTGIKFGSQSYGATFAYSVAYGEDKFVVVGASGKASYSYDGINWNSLTPGTNTGIKFGSDFAFSVTYGNDKFVVVGSSGKASYSSDGITWTSLTPGTNTGIKFGSSWDSYAEFVTYGNDKFVVVGDAGKASYSLDGINWTSLAAGTNTGIKFGTTDANSVAYGNGKFVVVGRSGKASYSSDGITWTSLTAGTNTGIKFGTTNAYSVTYGNGKFVVVGYAISSYSLDGVNWTNDDGSFSTLGYSRISYGAGIFVSAGIFGSTSYSTDGISWTDLTPHREVLLYNSDAYGFVFSIAYGDGKFVAVGGYGHLVYSYDGIHWSRDNVDLSFGDYLYSITYGAGKFITIGDGGQLHYSTNGITGWTSLPYGVEAVFQNNRPGHAMIYGGDKFVAVGYEGVASYSYDGISWIHLPAGSNTGIKFGDNLDGQDWKYHAYSIAYGIDKFVVVGANGKASYSYNGINWISLTPGNDTGIKFGESDAQSIAYGLGKFVVVGSSGKASYSSDGINWTSLPAGTDTGIKFGTDGYAYSIAYGGNKFVVVGHDGRASYSYDGVTWTSLIAGDNTGIKLGVVADAYTVAYGSGTWVVASFEAASYSVTPPNTSPFAPTLISPSNTSFINTPTPTLSANYTDPDIGDIGTTNYRISSNSFTDCINNTNIVASGTSAETSDENEDTTYTPNSSIGSDGTYYWCAQNNDGTAQSSWTQMGTFTLDTTPPTITSTQYTLGSLSDTQLATITWTTNEASSTQLEYGTTQSYGTTTTEQDTDTRVTSHTATITIPACSIYHVRTISKDQANNSSTSQDITIQTHCATPGNALANYSVGTVSSQPQESSTPTPSPESTPEPTPSQEPTQTTEPAPQPTPPQVNPTPLTPQQAQVIIIEIKSKLVELITQLITLLQEKIKSV